MKNPIGYAFVASLILTGIAIAVFPKVFTENSNEKTEQVTTDQPLPAIKDSTVLQKNEKYLSKRLNAQQIGILETQIRLRKGNMSYPDGHRINPFLSAGSDLIGIVKGYQTMCDSETHYILVDTVGGQPEDQWLPVPVTAKDIQIFRGELFRPGTNLTVIRTKKRGE